MSWTTSSVGELADVAIGPFGSSMKADSYVQEGLPVVAGGHLGDLRHPDMTRADRISEETATRLARSVLESGDLVFPHRGAIGRVGLVADRSMMSTSMMRARFNPEKVDAEFAYWYFKADGCSQLLTMASSVGTPGIGQPLASLKSVQMRVPSLVEQRGIAEVLNALEDKMAANRVVSDRADELLCAWAREARSEVSMVRLGSLLSLNYGRALPAPNRNGGNVVVVGSGGVAGYHDVKLVDGPVLVIGRKGTVGATHWIDGPAFPIDTTYWVKPHDGLPLLYLYYLLRDIDFAAMNHDSAVPGLNREQAYTVEVPAPNQELVAKFAEKSAGLLALRSARKRESEVLARTRDELLPLLMSGKITVKQGETRAEEVV